MRSGHCSRPWHARVGAFVSILAVFAPGLLVMADSSHAGPPPYDLVFVPPTPLPPNVAEGSTVTITVELQGGCDPFSPISWNADAVTGPFGSATQGVDFSVASPNLLMFDGPGGRFATTTITIFDDSDVEGPETFDLKLTPNGNDMLSCGPVGPNMPEYILTLTIDDDDAGPPPTLEIGDVQVNEGDSGTIAATFAVTLLNPDGSTVSVDFETVDNAATTSDGDYQATSGQLFFTGSPTRRAEGNVQLVTVLVNGDTQFEPDEEFFVVLRNAMGATIGDGTGSGVIVNDDPPPTSSTLEIDDVQLVEGAGGTTNAVFAVTLHDPPAASVVTVDFFTADGSATSASGDYQSTSGSLTFSGGTLGPSTLIEHISVPVFGDVLIEPDETFFVKLTNADGAAITDDTGVGTIVNDDSTGAEPALSIGDVVVAEGDTGNTIARFPIALDQPANNAVTVQFATRDDSATAGEDYLAASGTVTIPAGSNAVVLDIIVFGDVIPEANELFVVDLSNPDGATLADAEGRGFIQDDDPAALPTLTIDDISLLEGNNGTTEALFTLSMSPPSDSAISVSFATEDGSATGGTTAASDYLPTNGRVTLAAGETQRQVRVAVRGDHVPENDETFFLRLSEPSSATLGRDRGTATIVNDDEAELPLVSIGDVSVVEGDDGTADAVLKLTLNEASPTPVLVPFKTEDGTATVADNDYRDTGGTATIASGALETTITVPVVGDGRTEDDETFVVVLGKPQGALVADGKGEVTIVDDDAPLPRLSIDDVSIAEGDDGSTTALFTVRLSEMTATDVTMDVTSRDGTATAGQDYAAVETTLVIPAGEPTGQITVSVRGDLVPEDDETFFVVLTRPRGATLADGEGRATIVDDDEATAPSRLAIRNAVVREGDSGRTEAIFRVRLTPASDAPVIVSFRTRDDTATAGQDYEPRTDVLRFAPGQTNAAFNVAVRGDTVREGDEAFRVELFNPEGAIITNRVAVGTIVDDDVELGTIRLVSAPPAVERDGQATVTLRRDGNAQLPAQVRLTVAPGTAQAGQDFRAVSRVVRWAAGTGGDQTFVVRIRDDQQPEPDETVRLSLSDPLGAQLGAPRNLELVIVDDDTATRLDAVTDQQLTARARQQVAVVVRAVDDAGTPVAGAMVRWQIAGDATLLGDEDQRTNGEGLSRQPIRLGGMPGEVTVAAELVGRDSAIAFVITVEGDLVDLVDPDADPDDAGLAAVLDAACPQATGDLANGCAYIFGLENDGDRRQVISALRPRGAATTANRGLRTPEIQIRNLSERLRALRGATDAVGRLSFDQVSVNVRGEGLTVGSLRQTATTPRADRTLAARVDAALAAAKGEAMTDAKGRAIAGAKTVGAKTVGAKTVARGGTRPGTDMPLEPAQVDTSSATRGGAASADEDTFDTGASRWGLFLTGRLTIGDAPNTRREAGYEFSTEGITAGVDYRLGERVVLGAALGYLRSDTDVARNLGQADVSGYSLSTYATYYRTRFYADGLLSYGANQYDLSRVILLPAPFQGRRELRAVADADGNQLAANLGFGYDMRLGQATSLEGFARLGYTRAEVDAYRERGAGPFNLAFASQSLESVLSEAGLEVTRPFSLRWGVLQPSLRVAYLHEFADDDRLIRVRFLADSGARIFSLRTDAPDRDFFNLGAALTATFRRGWATFAQYDTDLARDDLNVYTVTVGVRKQLP